MVSQRSDSRHPALLSIAGWETGRQGGRETLWQKGVHTDSHLGFWHFARFAHRRFAPRLSTFSEFGPYHDSYQVNWNSPRLEFYPIRTLHIGTIQNWYFPQLAPRLIR